MRRDLGVGGQSHLHSTRVQGGFGGGLLATVQSILRDTFAPKQLGMSQGIYAIGAIMGPALGPPLGGVLVDNASWNLVFYINVMPGLFAIVPMLLLKDPDKAVAGAIDVVGLVLLAASLGSMQDVLTKGEQNYWFADPTIVAMTFVMVVTLVGFVFWELFGTMTPVVDLRILRNRSVAKSRRDG